MKFLDPKNVTTRANRMMKAHLQIFEKHLGRYEAYDNSWFFGDEENWINVAYKTDNKFMTKVFATSVRMSVADIDLPEDWSVRSQYLGAFTPQGLFFRETMKQNAAMTEEFNHNGVLMQQLFALMQGVDLTDIRIRYQAAERKLYVEVNPYAGAFIWVKLPPVYHDIRLKEEEISRILLILTTLREYFVQNYGGGAGRTVRKRGH